MAGNSGRTDRHRLAAGGMNHGRQQSGDRHGDRRGHERPGREVPDLQAGRRGVWARNPEGSRDHQDDGDHARAADAGVRTRGHQPARQSHPGHRPAAQIRHGCHGHDGQDLRHCRAGGARRGARDHGHHRGRGFRSARRHGRADRARAGVHPGPAASERRRRRPGCT